MLYFKICTLQTVLVGEANCENVNAIISQLLTLPDVFLHVLQDRDQCFGSLREEVTILLQVSAATHFIHKEPLKKVLLLYIYLKHNKNKVVHMKNGLTRTQFFWSFIERKSLILFPVTFREIGVLFCNYFPCLLYMQCLPQIFEIKVWLFVIFFCTYGQFWSCILIVFVNMDYVF